MGVPLDAQDEDGNTALHMASYEKHLNTIKLLIRKGCNMYLRNGQGRTFLQVAVKWHESYESRFIELLVILKDFVGRDVFLGEGGIFHKALERRYGASIPGNVKEVLK